MEIKRDLPKFSKREFDLGTWKLQVSGLVNNLRDLRYDDLLKLPRVSITDDFSCLEGWVVKDISWEGVKLSSVLQLLAMKPEARFVVLAAGQFSICRPLQRAMEETTILALRQGGIPLDEYHGGPVRLVLRDQQCFQSIKGLDQIILSDTEQKGTAADIALSRIGRENR